MGLRDIGSSLPPGFRFYPSDEELVCHYLYKKIANEEILKGTLVEIDLHTCEPWQLPDVAKLNSNEWYFFNFRDRKYATGFRTNRATASGYWKATGKDRAVLDPQTRMVVGMRKTLVFYKNRAPNGIKSGWIMHEFRLENPHAPPKEDWVLCRVFHKSKCESSDTYENNFGDTPSADAYMPSAYQSNITSLGSSVPDPAKHGLDPTHHHDHMNLEPHHQFQISTSSHTKIMVEHTKSEDDYGFLFDMSFDDSNAVPLSFVEDMTFDKDESSMFI